MTELLSVMGSVWPTARSVFYVSVIPQSERDQRVREEGERGKETFMEDLLGTRDFSTYTI